MRSHSLLGKLATASSLALAMSAAQAIDSDSARAESVARGKYMAIAADCAACHTSVGGKAFAGGLAVASPVGKIYASNITPSVSDGIGNYSEAQFDRALRHGIRGDGANLYPAMPYVSYAVFTDADVKDLYAYFKGAVAPVDEPAPKTDLPFPMNIRMSMKAWNLLFLKARPFENDVSRSPEWNRGKYLVEGAAHCGECHTPRGFLMEKKSGRTFAGTTLDAWYAPNITSDKASGIGSWSQPELVQFLRTGALRGKAYAAGSMGEAVERSFQHLIEADLQSIAVYVGTIPAIHDSGDTKARFDFGKPFSQLATLRGSVPVLPSTVAPGAAELFDGNCGTCHSAAGQGSADGYFPSLFTNSAVGAKHGTNLIATMLEGVDRTTPAGQSFMPAFAAGPKGVVNALSDVQIAAIGNYVLANFGPGDVTVSAEQVAEGRRGGPGSPLVLLARVALGAGVVFVLFVVFLWLRRRRRKQAAA